MVIVSVLSVQTPFLRVSSSESRVIQMRQEYYSSHGDIFTLLNVYSHWLYQKTSNQVRSGSSEHEALGKVTRD
jgi:HrpA-like RNA helicase